jgi:hypothetical protein
MYVHNISHYRAISAFNCSTCAHACSISLILNWTAGDVFKTYYFLSTGAPFQFVLCGLVQLAVDALIVVQMWVYR